MDATKFLSKYLFEKSVYDEEPKLSTIFFPYRLKGINDGSQGGNNEESFKENKVSCFFSQNN